MATTPEVIPPRKPPVPASARVKAAKLRGRARAGLPLSTEEATELHDYEKDRGASRSASRKVSYTEEESAAQAEGTGSAAEAAAAGAMVREEGRRIDSLLTIGVSALQSAFDRVLKSNEQILDRNAKLEDAQIKMMEAVRTHYVARAQAEGDAILDAAERDAEAAADKKEDPIMKALGDLAPTIIPMLMAKMAESGPAKK